MAAILLLVSCSTSHAQAPPPDPLEVTVTANRMPTAIQRTGSAISVIHNEDIQRSGPATVSEVLRSVPGVTLAQTAGPASVTSVFLRGTNSGQTLVLLDGVRINDPTQPGSGFDLSFFAPALIERIEVLRGPQSALYGSDAIGGVINIITKTGRSTPRSTLGIEAGTYGTLSTTAGISGTAGPWSYAFSGTAISSGGFSSYGFRIGRIESRLGPLENDPFTRFGGFGRIGYDPGNGFRFEISALSVETRGKFDNAFGSAPDTRRNLATNRLAQVAARAELETFGGRLVHSLQLYANRSNRISRDSDDLRLRFDGVRTGAEYQARLGLDPFGSLIAGGRLEREQATTRSPDFAVFPPVGETKERFSQSTGSLFALWQLPVGERLVLSLGGRADKVTGSDAFLTWRATAAYLIPETGTKLRTSAGTGAKAPSLFQRFSEFATPGLRPETSFGIDAGIDQDVLDGKVTLSATAFANRLRNLIDFQSDPRCLATQAFGCYVNVARAVTSGVEVGGRARIIDGLLSAHVSYTYLRAKDETTSLALARRPQHLARLALQITPTAQWLIEPSVIMVSERFSAAGEGQRLAPYARLDLYTDYRVNETWKAHARVENITDTRYQEVAGFGTTGRAVYAGLTATW